MYQNTKNKGFITIPILIAIVIGATVVAGTGGYYVANQMQNTPSPASENDTNQINNDVSSATTTEPEEVNDASTTTDMVSELIEDNELEIPAENTEPEIITQKPPVQAVEPVITQAEIPPTVPIPVPTPVVDYQKICTEEAEVEYAKSMAEAEKFIEENELKIEAEVSQIEKFIRETEADERRLVSETRSSHDALIQKEEDYYDGLIRSQRVQNISSGVSQYSPSSADSSVQAIEAERDSVISDYERQKDKAVDNIREESEAIIEKYEDAIDQYESQTARLRSLAKEEAVKVREVQFQSCMARN